MELNRFRFSSLALILGGVLFFLYPTLRPFSDEISMFGAFAFSSKFWLFAHVFAMLGFILVLFGLFGVYLSLVGTKAEKVAYLFLFFSMMGVGLTLPYYGMEAFAMNGIGTQAYQLKSEHLMKLANELRVGPGIYFLFSGLLLIAIGSIFTAIAVWKSQTYPKWSGIFFAIGFTLFIPQFFGSQPIRIAHGLLITISCIWLSIILWKQKDQRMKEDPPLIR